MTICYYMAIQQGFGNKTFHWGRKQDKGQWCLDKLQEVTTLLELWTSIQASTNTHSSTPQLLSCFLTNMTICFLHSPLVSRDVFVPGAPPLPHDPQSNLGLRSQRTHWVQSRLWAQPFHQHQQERRCSGLHHLGNVTGDRAWGLVTFGAWALTFFHAIGRPFINTFYVSLSSTPSPSGAKTWSVPYLSYT